MTTRNEDIERADDEYHQKLAEHISRVIKDPKRYVPNVSGTPTQQGYEKDDEELKQLKLKIDKDVESLHGSSRFSFAIARILRSFSVNHTLFPNDAKQLICTTKDTTCAQAWRILSQNNVQSIPVLESGPTSNGVITDLSKSGKVIGCVSMESMLKLMIKSVKVEDFKQQQFSSILEKREQARKKSLADVIELEPLYCVTTNTLVFDAVQEMVNRDAHRLVVVDEEGKLINIITQSRIIQVIAGIIDSIPDEANSSLESLGLSTHPVVTVDSSTLTIEAFHTMFSQHVSAVGVVDSKGNLTGVLTTTDIKELGPTLDNFHMLGSPVYEFFAFVRKNRRIGTHLPTKSIAEEKRPEMITSPPAETLANAILKINHWRIHRLFIVQNNKPVGCLSLYDILKYMIADKPKQLIPEAR